MPIWFNNYNTSSCVIPLSIIGESGLSSPPEAPPLIGTNL
jgi:hypothetical protein